MAIESDGFRTRDPATPPPKLMDIFSSELLTPAEPRDEVPPVVELPAPPAVEPTPEEPAEPMEPAAVAEPTAEPTAEPEQVTEPEQPAEPPVEAAYEQPAEPAPEPVQEPAAEEQPLNPEPEAPPSEELQAPVVEEEPTAKPEPHRKPGAPGKRWVFGVGTAVILISGALAVFIFLAARALMRKPSADTAGLEIPGTTASAPAVQEPAVVRPRFSVPRPAGGSAPVPATTPAHNELPPASTQPAAGGSSQSDLLDRLASGLAPDMASGNNGLKPFIAKASLSLFSSAHALTDKDLREATQEERAILMAYQELFSQLGINLGRGESRLADIDQLLSGYERLASSLQNWKKMEISSLALCRAVKGFGRYDAFEDNTFPARSIPTILVYAELAHFKQRLQPDGKYALRLKEEFALFDTAAEPKEVWKELAMAATDVSASPKKDLYLAQYLRLPKTIAPGNYTLKVRVTDQSTGETSVGALPMTLAASP